MIERGLRKGNKEGSN